MATRSMKFDRNTGEYIYLLNDEPVTKEKWHETWHIKPTDFSKGECPKVEGDHGDWSAENGGRGRFAPQVNAYCKNPGEILDKGRAKGYRKLG